MLLDTGAPDSFLTPAAYNRLNLTGLHQITGYATGFGGNAQLNKVIMEDLVFGHLTVRNDVMILADYGTPMRNGKPLTDGLIGEDVLDPFDIAFDLASNHIMLFLPRGCAASGTPWPGNYAPLPFTLAKNNAPLIVVSVDGQPLNMALDSGSTHTFAEQSALARENVKPEAVIAEPHESAGLGNLVIKSGFEQFASLTIGAENFSDSWLDVGNSKLVGVEDGVVGDDYLSNHRVFIAHSAGIVFLGLTEQ